MTPRSRALARLAFACALALPVDASAQPIVPSPPAPTSIVQWSHDGAGVTRFEIWVDGTAVSTVPVTTAPEGDWTEPLPWMIPGIRTIQVAACNDLGCAASAPLTVRVISGPIRWATAGGTPGPTSADQR